MKDTNDFTQGKILGPLFGFAGPILFALFLQALYGAIDLVVVGQFGTAADVSAVATGAQIMQTLTNIISSFSMGITVLLGQKIGEGKRADGGTIIGASMFLLMIIGVILSVAIPFLSPALANVMNAPEDAFDLAVSYIRICGGGSVVIIAYNLIGSIFRGIGDAKTPLITVLIACFINIGGDLLLVAVFDMGTKGAAIATVAAQAVSVVVSVYLISKKDLPFEFHMKQFRPVKDVIGRVTSIGFPIALQDFLVGVSFLIILAIVNTLGVVSSAGVGVAEKVCNFIMLVPSAFSQAMSAFVAQNYGARKYERATRALWMAIGSSTMIGVVMFYISFFHGNLLAGIFTTDPDVILAASDYLRAYAIDCLLTCFLFCFIGFFNGLGVTKFVMAQGIIAAFAVRIPVAYFMSRQPEVSLFKIGLGIPMSTVLQICMCFVCYAWVKRKKLVYQEEHTS